MSLSLAGRRRPALWVLTFALIVAAMALRPMTASATTYTLDGVDNTLLNVNWFPSLSGGKAPTILIGTGFGVKQSMVQGIDGVGGQTLILGNSNIFPALGVETLTADGFNVITWDPRGEYGSMACDPTVQDGPYCGQLETDNPQYEAQDVMSIISWLKYGQPNAPAPDPNFVKFDPDNWPAIGMTGDSLGGAVQLEAAGLAAQAGHPIDVIEPGAPFDNGVDAFEPSGVDKEALDNYFCSKPALDPTNFNVSAGWSAMCSAVDSGSFGPPGSPAQTYLASAGPTSTTDPLAAIGPQTLVFLWAGGVDTAFPLNLQAGMYNTLKSDGVPVKMMWLCAGHGLCNQSYTPAFDLVCAQHAFLDHAFGIKPQPIWVYDSALNQWLQYNDTSATGYEVTTNGSTTFTAETCNGDTNDLTALDFEYADQGPHPEKDPTQDPRAVWQTLPTYPSGATAYPGSTAPNGPTLTGSNSGNLNVNPTAHSSGNFIGGTVAFNAVNINIPVSAISTSWVDAITAPTLTLTYRGTASPITNTPVFAQLAQNNWVGILDNVAVIDNQVTPIPLTLDGQQRTLKVPLNPVIWRITPSSSIELQLTDESNVFYSTPTVGSVQLQATVSLPTELPGSGLN